MYKLTESYEKKIWEQLVPKINKNDLLEIMSLDLSDYFAVKVWEYLQKEGISRWDLPKIIRNSPPKYTNKAVKQFLKITRSLYGGHIDWWDLTVILSHAPDDYKRKAIEQVFKQKNLEDDQLRTIINYGPEDCAVEAWQLLFKKGAKRHDLVRIIHDAQRREDNSAQLGLHQRLTQLGTKQLL